ncbi:MAG: flagellar biosynthesis anti-sigma factor FlgM [Burkholderiales bacterium]|nr:flagellar biosynthesis anti-sigma factor FlgM [Burkholderiales bacterium]MDE2455273.1 flagellar biosynthesis anti-sigma factor FlgM [Burkholderiales bacterium]
MKIGPLDNKPTATPVAGERKSASAPAPAGQATEPSAKVALSSAAQVAGTSGEGSFDKVKVASISSSIAKGTYQVHPEVIADKLIANARERLGATSN